MPSQRFLPLPETLINTRAELGPAENRGEDDSECETGGYCNVSLGYRTLYDMFRPPSNNDLYPNRKGRQFLKLDFKFSFIDLIEMSGHAL